MRLKSLEIKGFKSFANETAIHFNGDVIGVVGPNGSGKSNVVDAIRWVLGEQKSSQLRLDKMASIIFSGTKKRKEAQMAQVSLTFENTKNVLPTDYQTVTVTRILYRSGDSEYRLNGVSCRLKDITSLFLDTGIGPDSYAIIALNMVEDLLSDREHSRRKMFEQAAGISKYKSRKHETEVKLEATTADLERVEDLLFEIEGNLKSLEKQAKRTEKFYEMKAEYKKLAVELAVHNLAKHKSDYKKMESEIAKGEDEYRRAEADSHTFDAKIESLRRANLEKEVGLSDAQREMNQLVGRIRSRENEKQMLAQKLGFIEQNAARLGEQIASATGQIGRLTNEVEHYQTENSEERRLEGQLDARLDEAQKRLEKVRADHALMRGSLDEFSRAQQSVEREIMEFEKRRAINANQIDNLSRDVERAVADANSRKTDLQLVENQLVELVGRESAQAKKIEEIDGAEQKRLEQIAKTETEIDGETKKAAELHRSLDAKRNEFKLTKSLVENLEGFPESIQFLSKQKDWAKNAPLLSDIIYVKEDFRVAIENFLEPWLNFYVVPDTVAALEAIQLLGRSQKGRANFFLLDAFQKYDAPLAMFPEAQAALELVEIDPQYRNLVAYLLENVLITQKEPTDFDLAGYPNLTLISKSGTMTKRKFSLSGGSIGLFEGKKIGRKKNLEILEADIKKLEITEKSATEKLQTMRAHLQNLRTGDRRAELSREKDALNRLLQERAGLRARQENFSIYLKNFDSKAAESGQLIEKFRADNLLIDKELNEKHQTAERLKDRLTGADTGFQKIAQELSDTSANFNQVNIEFIRQQNKVNALQQELSFRQKSLSDQRELIVANEKNKLAALEEIGLINDDLQRIEKELIKGYQEKKEKESTLSGVEQAFFKAKNEINEIEDAQRGNYRKQQEQQININKLKEKFNDVKFEITAIGERLRVEFTIGVNDVINNEPNAAYEIVELNKEVESLKRKLDSYGEINPMAIEAYNEIKERYDVIIVQREDILEAKAHLLETIKEIEATATARFLESFEQVRINFISVFRSLFTEDDTADLTLSNPSNPLESDINIIAKPKGKRPQHINQLSGGEKTLTATALLFALYLLKPAPFCVFDEVDAPLDDANIEKFNRIIKRFSADSQFIIVTHNKATMAAVDVIYGVYMPEQGVSAVSPVDFRELGHEAMVFEAG